MADIEKVNAIELESADKKYILDFDRASCEWAERHGFSVEDLTSGRAMVGLGDLFYYAFRKNHPNMTRIQTDRILFEEMGGMPEGMAERLAELYAQPYNALIQTEEAAKNSKWKVTM